MILGSPAAARQEARGAPPWPAPGPAQLAAGVHAAGLTLLAASGEVQGSVLLTPHLVIAVTYRPGSLPVPARYAFPAGT